jgi:hypothetical protein
MPTRANVFSLASMALLPTLGQEIRLPFAEDEINRPAAPDVRPGAAAVLDQVVVIAPGIEQGIGEESEEGGVQSAFWQVSLVVGGLGEAKNRAIVPAEDSGRQGRRRMERIAEDVAN